MWGPVSGGRLGWEEGHRKASVVGGVAGASAAVRADVACGRRGSGRRQWYCRWQFTVRWQVAQQIYLYDIIAERLNWTSPRV